MAQIERDINISVLAINYPEIVDFLIQEYGFHCIGCFVAEFETLEEGARVHGIIDDDFDEMLVAINNKAKEISNNKTP